MTTRKRNDCWDGHHQRALNMMTSNLLAEVRSGPLGCL